MDKDIVTNNHNISINQRKSIAITGVKKIENFDENEFLLETNMGFILIKGSNLEKTLSDFSAFLEFSK